MMVLSSPKSPSTAALVGIGVATVIGAAACFLYRDTLRTWLTSSSDTAEPSDRASHGSATSSQGEQQGSSTDGSTTPGDSPPRKCLCGKPASRRCTKCKQSYYCSRDCQREDWVQRGHNKRCAAWCSIHDELQGAMLTLRAGRLDVARTHCDNVFRACDAVDSPLALLAAIALKAQCQVYGNNFQAAEDLFGRGLAAAVNLLREVEAHPEWRDGQAQWALQHAAPVSELTKPSDAITVNDVLKQQAGCYSGLAAVARHKGNLQAAIQNSQLALRVSQRLGDRSVEASALSALGTATFHIDKSEGIEHLQAAAHLRRSLLVDTLMTKGVIVDMAQQVSQLVTCMLNVATALGTVGGQKDAIVMYTQALLFAMDLNAQLYLRILTLFHNATEQCGHEFGARLDLSLEDSPSTSRATPSATQTPERSSTGACAQDANASVDAARADTDANARGVTAHAVTAHASSSTDPRDASAIGTNAEACESGDAEACESGESGGDDAQYVGSEDEVWSMLVRGYVRQAPSSAGADLRGVLRSRVAEVRDMSSKSGYERAAWARTELGKWLQEIKGRELSDECSICLDSMTSGSASTEGKEIIVLECLHLLHVGCWNSWLATSQSDGRCPVCQSHTHVVEVEATS